MLVATVQARAWLATDSRGKEERSNLPHGVRFAGQRHTSGHAQAEPCNCPQHLHDPALATVEAVLRQHLVLHREEELRVLRRVVVTSPAQARLQLLQPRVSGGGS